MKSRATFYHAGCPVCVEAEQGLTCALDANKYDVEIVHLGNDKRRIEEARKNGIKSVPALLVDRQVFHINFGASLNDLV